MILQQKHTALLQEAERRGATGIAPLRLCLQMLSLATAIDGDCAARLAPFGLSEGKFVMLFLLQGQAEGLSPHELAERAGVSRATVTGLLDGLERDGFLARQGGLADRRKIRVLLSAKGAAMAQDLFQRHTAWISTLFSGLSETEQQTLTSLLARVWRNTDVGKAAS